MPSQYEAYYEQGLAITREIGDRKGEENALCNLGVVYNNLGEPKRAFDFFKQHLAIARAISDKQGQGNALWNMTLVLEQLDRQRQAIEYAETALEIFEQIESSYAKRVRQQLTAWQKNSKNSENGTNTHGE